MSPSRSRHPLSGTAGNVVREIDKELTRLQGYEKVAAAERKVLLSARAVLTANGVIPARRRRVSQAEVSAYLSQHPGSWPAEIAEALQAPATNVSMHLHRGRDQRYERREDGWHLRGSD